MGDQREKGTSWREPLERTFLARGERLTAASGAMVVALVLAVLGAAAWWTLDVYRDTRRKDDARRIDAVGTLLSANAELLIESGEMTTLRRVVADTARRERFSRCRVALLDGTIVADAEPAKIAARVPAEGWPEARTPGAETVAKGASVFPMQVRGRGAAELQIVSGGEWSAWGDARAQLGLGLIAAGAMVLVGVVYRVMRARMRTLGAIADALRLASRGETAPGLLRVDDALGASAMAWNELVADRHRLLLEAKIEKVVGEGAAPASHDGALGTAFDAITHGVVLVDAGMGVRYANGAAVTLLAAGKKATGGPASFDLRAALGQADAITAVEGVASGKTRQRASVELKRAGEGASASVLRLTVKPLGREHEEGAVLLIEDVTQQRVADQSRNAFVAQATHELRTPLTNIRLYVEALVDDGDQDPATRAKCLNVVSQEVRRLERIVSDMLSVSEIEAGSMKLHTGDVRLETLFEELANDYRAQAADKEIALAFHLPPKWPNVQGDRDKIALALHNLIGNALKYTPPGGKVAITVQEAEGALQVDVADNGIGIKSEEHELIFDRFYRAKDKRIAGITGSGLGLALAREIARLHGGDITLRSEVDKGSTFKFAMPLAAGGSASAAPRSKAA